MKIISIEPKSLWCVFAAGLMLTSESSRIAAQSSALPPDVQRAIAKTYVSTNWETRYLDGTVDLNGDGKSEIVVHVVGGGACGTGGCPTLVFTPTASGYQAKPFPRDAPSAAGASASAAPSFDCAKATVPAEKVVCADPPLAALDRAVAGAYSKAMKIWNEAARATQRSTQRQWLDARNACVRPGAVNAVVIDCLQGSYRRRLIEIQTTGGLLTAPAAVEYRCENSTERFTAAFYNQTDPQSVVLTWGNRQVVALAARSASGARYTAQDVEFWEHQGEAAVKWSGTSLACKPVK